MDNPNSTIMHTPKKNTKLNRDAVNKIRYGSPQLKEVLRQRCRQRIREKRNELVNARRFGANGIDDVTHEILFDVVKQELGFMTTDDEEHSDVMANNSNDSQEEMLNFEQEILDDQEQFIMEQYEFFENFMDGFFQYPMETHDVLCPICQKSMMTEGSGVIVCSGCQFTLPLKMSLQDFSNTIKLKTINHSENCTCLPAFITVPENDTISLYLTCEACSCCVLIM